MARQIRYCLIRLSVSSHVLDHSRLAAFHVGDAVLVVFGARIDIHSFIDGRCKISMGSLLSQVRA